ncbi:MAG: peptide deformylase [Atribacterota bacterium]|nr:peptide deformylase [Atribacterota bacterium]
MESPIKYYGDRFLRNTPKDVVFPRNDLKQIAMSMFIIMYKEMGVGLAANQVGIDERIAVINIDPEHKEESQIVLINPKIISQEGEFENEEGCLSFPDIRANVKRSEKIEVENYDYDGKKSVIKADGLLSIALQHEIDHLNGKLFIDNLSFIDKNLLGNKLKRLSRKTKKG